MPIDRAATLKNAEKLLRQGKLDLAIGEYVRLAADQPRDFNSANVLGDLYVRAGQVDRAVEQFTRIADALNEEGFLPKAGALYKKILKVKPDHEHALIQSAEITSSQGLFADARNYLNAVAERRRARGDQRGVAQIRIRLGSLDPADFDARLDAARARAEIGDTRNALAGLKEIAAELIEKGRETAAIEVLREAAGLDPEDEELRERLLAIYISAGDFARARECAVTSAQFKSLAAALEERGNADHALDALREASRLDPNDAALKTHLGRTFVARGDLATAAQYLTVESAGDDPQLLLTVAEIRLRGGAPDEGLSIIRRLLSEDASRREQIAQLGWTLAEQDAGIGFQVVEIAADAAVERSDWPGAAAALQEFVTRVRDHIPALLRLVEVCVDGGLEATMYSAQAQLADAYIAAGQAAEARFIAEDLVACEPWERSNVERFRRALVLLGEADPDALIAERLSGQSPFMSTDLSLSDFPPFETPEPAFEALEAPDAAAAEPSADQRTGSQGFDFGVEAQPLSSAAPAAERRGKETSLFQLSANAIDLDSILGELEERPGSPEMSEHHEIDLSIELDDFKPGRTSPESQARSTRPPIEATDLEGVFEQLRTEASRQPSADAAETAYKKGVTLREAGRIEEAIQALEEASRSPRLRFQASSLLGRIHLERNAMPQAIECFEKAAQAPASSVDEGHQLFYDLAQALETVGEVARALAICLELQAEAGDYRDVSERVERLAKVQTRG